ncbi:MAG: YHS domain-containing (seleno)protein [Phycisphaerales bacterium]
MNVSGASKVALSGFDPVGFFENSTPVNGLPQIRAEHRGATYLFASEANQDAFLAEPDRYAPQYGGFCAYGVSINVLLPVDISTAQVRDGKLYLNVNPDIRARFDADYEGSVSRANANWAGLFERHAE